MTASFPDFVCPVDYQRLVASLDGRMRCAAGHEYAFRRGIPRFVATKSKYADALKITNAFFPLHRAVRQSRLLQVLLSEGGNGIEVHCVKPGGAGDG